jgi:hypothetical protein
MKYSLLFIVMIFASTGCANYAPVDPISNAAGGRCKVNSDCGAGERCANGSCEDIYYPRKHIKNY